MISARKDEINKLNFDLTSRNLEYQDLALRTKNLQSTLTHHGSNVKQLQKSIDDKKVEVERKLNDLEELLERTKDDLLRLYDDKDFEVKK